MKIGTLVRLKDSKPGDGMGFVREVGINVTGVGETVEVEFVSGPEYVAVSALVVVCRHCGSDVP